MASYVDNKELYSEICISIKQEKLTKKAQDMLILIAERANNKLHYTNQQDKEDCIQFALLDLFRYWDRFKPEKTTNAFSYYTQIAKNGYARGWNKIHPSKYKGTLSLEGGSNPDSDGIYSV